MISVFDGLRNTEKCKRCRRFFRSRNRTNVPGARALPSQPARRAGFTGFRTIPPGTPIAENKVSSIPTLPIPPDRLSIPTPPKIRRIPVSSAPPRPHPAKKQPPLPGVVRVRHARRASSSQAPAQPIKQADQHHAQTEHPEFGRPRRVDGLSQRSHRTSRTQRRRSWLRGQYQPDGQASAGVFEQVLYHAKKPILINYLLAYTRSISRKNVRTSDCVF